ncbi:Carboxylesterase [Andreprevotia sp. IGB-42]|uniref:alpha/beta hydrolase n=1 Tax=Andreprevotia sp. IGB-42 TaxID=2497473 RepID=UPI00135C7013|nr:alpha/beta fold hydrolase [Andreprevotia sp. IGB-42]KAF0814711.1 Carboxylesterase [Andreprevotia sp. IGB-42]
MFRLDAQDAILLVHGLAGSETEMRPLGKKLEAAGFAVEIPLLAGHGSTPAELAATHWQQWYASAEAALESLLARYPRVSIGGLCMGSLLSIKLAHKYQHRLRALILVSPTMFFDGWAQPWYRFILPLVVKTPLKHRLSFPEAPPYGIKNAKLRSRLEKQIHAGQSHYGATPVAAIHEVMQLIDTLTPQVLGEMYLPTLIVHALEDEVAAPTTPLHLKQHLAHCDCELVWLEDSYHMATMDNQRDRVSQHALRMLRLAGHQASLPALAPFACPTALAAG